MKDISRCGGSDVVVVEGKPRSHLRLIPFKRRGGGR